MTNDLDALLTALYVHLDDDVIPSAKQRTGPGRPPLLTDAELVCVAVAQVLLRCDDERRWLRLAPTRIGHLFGRLPGQSEYTRHLTRLAPIMFTTLGWLARHTPTWWENLRLMDGTPVPCGASRTTVHRSALGEVCGYGRDASHHRFYWGSKLMLITTADGTVVSFSLANPKELDERKQALHLIAHQATGPAPDPEDEAGPRVVVCDKGFAGAGIEKAMAEVDHVLVRPARKDEAARPFPGWLRQRVEAIIWTLKNQLGLERHGARTAEGLWARVCQRILALNAAIWHNWLIGAPVKRSLVAYDH
ncbi:transposase [Nocardiopsis nanhaiensis]